MPGAIRAAKELPAAFDAMTDHAAPTVLAHGRQFVDGAFEAVKHVTVTGCDHLEAQRIIVTANFADCHVCETDFVIVPHCITVMWLDWLNPDVPERYPLIFLTLQYDDT